jgi:putative ABC transport system ATP-binding protein
MEIMQRLNEETGSTFIFATHDPRVFPFARRIVEVRDGQVAENSKHA